MSKFYVPGPSNNFAAVGAGPTYLHLGFVEQSVRLATAVRHEGVSADFAAGMDADIQMLGEDIVVSFRLVRYNEPVLNLCRKRLGSSLSTAPGSGGAGALGALLGQQQNTYSLAIVSQYAAMAAFSDMLPGIVIPKAYLADSHEVELGVKTKMPQVLFRGLGTFGLDGSYQVFHSDFTGLTLPEVA
jgi:hypothetical protein